MLLSGVMTLTYWLFQPQEYPVLVTTSFATGQDGKIKKVFRIGEHVFHYREGVIMTNAHRLVSLSLVEEGTGIAWVIIEPTLAQTSGMPLGPFSKHYHFIQLPSHLPLGGYIVKARVIYRLNPLRTSESYEVLPFHFKVVK